MNLGILCILGGFVVGVASAIGSVQLTMEWPTHRRRRTIAVLVGIMISMILWAKGFVLIGAHLSKTVTH